MWQTTVARVLALSLSLSVTAQPTTIPQGNHDSSRSAPQLIDPGFEKFTLVSDSSQGWSSDEPFYPHDPRFGVVVMRPDAVHKVEGAYSLRIEQPRHRPPGRGQAFLCQSVQMPKNAPRRYDLSAQMRGLNGPILIHVYVWEPNNVARAIAERRVSLSKDWAIASLKFNVPRGYDRFGIWFYLPRDEEVQLWLDDVRLRPSAN